MPIVRFVAVGATRLTFVFVFVEMRDGRVAALDRDDKQKRIWQYPRHERMSSCMLLDFLLDCFCDVLLD